MILQRSFFEKEFFLALLSLATNRFENLTKTSLKRLHMGIKPVSTASKERD
jgi:hypothetical protein